MPEEQSSSAWRAAAAAPFVAQAQHLEAAVAVLCKAFDRDPVTDWYLRTDAKRAWALRNQFVGILGGWALELGHTYLAQDEGACAVLLPPDPEHQGRGVLEWVQLVERVRHNTGWARLHRVLRLIIAMDRHHVRTAPHAYLWFLGVDPARAGHGVGAVFLDAVLAHYDRQQVPTYLENSNPRNQPFYQRLGYHSLGEYRPLFGGPPLEPMWREARAR
ncbi:MAG TPA: GNAT family N-acetyltransferase [bacterium]|nr:GNAT family N-acetyltransferase [bacterium]